jgi:RNA polymerase sigma-70 factor (ECF subfamily)
VSATHDNSTGPVGPELLRGLIDRHAAALELYAGQFVDCPEDVLQEVLVDLARLDKRPENVVAWLYRAVRHRALNAQRSARRRKRHEAAAARQKASVIEGKAVGEVDSESITLALETLPRWQREVVVAHLWGGLTFDEIGRLIGASDSTAHRRYRQGLATMREKLRLKCPNTS